MIVHFVALKLIKRINILTFLSFDHYLLSKYFVFEIWKKKKKKCQKSLKVVHYNKKILIYTHCIIPSNETTTPIRLNEWSDCDRGWLNARTRDIIVEIVKDIGHDAAWPTPGFIMYEGHIYLRPGSVQSVCTHASTLGPRWNFRDIDLTRSLLI